MLQAAARHVASEGVDGSCTACLLTVNQATGVLQSANLGDSGFLLVGALDPSHPAGPLGVKHRSSQLEHEFGCPYQLGHHAAANAPEDAELATMQVCVA